MLKILASLWVGVVGGTAGASIGLVVAVLLLTMRFDLDVAMRPIEILALVGAISGVVVGIKKFGGT